MSTTRPLWLPLGAACALAACTRDIALPPVPSPDGFISGTAAAVDPETDLPHPVSGALATVVGSNLHVSTDATGTFTLGPLRQGTYQVLFRWDDPAGPTRERLVTGIDVQRGATTAIGQIVLHENAAATGRVLLAGETHGNLGAVAFVPGLPFVAPVADDGTYFLRGLPEGPVHFSGFKSGYQSAVTDQILLSGGVLTTAPDLILPPQTLSAPGSLHGMVQVVDKPTSDGVAVWGYRLASVDPDVKTVTLADGTFVLDNLAPDLWRLHVELTGYIPVDVANIPVNAGQSANAPETIVLAPGSLPADAGVQPGGDGGPGGGDGGNTGGLPQCITSIDCPLGQVCDARICRVGNCVTTSDCTGADLGLVCQSHQCSGCANDGQCPFGQLCNRATQRCTTPGGCRVNSDCGARVCDPASSMCVPCGGGSFADAGLTGGCGPGQVCDLFGSCRVGDCVTNNDCPVPGGTRACLGFFCAACRTDPQCGPANVCTDFDGGACVPGSCHGDSQCAPNQVCANYQCVGNCRSSLDCPPASGFCSAATHQCTPCTQSSDCGNGRTCGTGAQAGQCLQTGPSFGAFTDAGSSAGVYGDYYGVTPVIGRAAVYVAPFFVNATYVANVTALDPASLQVLWQEPIPGGSNQDPNSALAVPAQGVPGGEVYVASFGVGMSAFAAGGDGRGHGRVMWQSPLNPNAFSAGLWNGRLALAVNSGGRLTLLEADDGAVLVDNQPINGCTGPYGFPLGPGNATTWGTDFVFVPCSNGVAAMRPADGTEEWFFTYPGGIQLNQETPLSLWRPPGAAHDVVLFAGNYPSDGGTASAVFALDASPVSPTLLYQTAIPAVDGSKTLVLVDPQMNVTVGAELASPARFGYTRLDPSGRVLIQGNTTGLDETNAILASDGSLVGFQGGQICGIALTNGSSSGTLWQLAPPTGIFADLTNSPYFNAGWLAASLGGPAYAWVFAGGGGYTPPANLVELNGPGGGPFIDAPPAWPELGGSPSQQRRAPAYQCRTAADCTALDAGVACLLDRCAGNCLAPSDCQNPTQGCTLDFCGACVADEGCRAQQACFWGGCYACALDGGACAFPSTCHTTADCVLGQTCVSARCAPLPQQVFDQVNAQTANTLYTEPVQGPSGTVYMVQFDAGGMALQAYDLDGGAQWPSPVPLTGSVVNAFPPLAMAVPGIPGDSIFWVDSAAVPGRVFRVSPGIADGGEVASAAPSQYLYSTVAEGLSKGRHTLFGIGNSSGVYVVYALDAQTLLTTWTAASGCSMSGQRAPVIGSDGTLYVFCDGLQFQAWDPDGDPSNVWPPLPSNAGKLLWTSNSTFTSAAAPAIVRPPGSATDLLLAQVYDTAQWRVLVAPVSALGYGPAATSPAGGAPPVALSPGVSLDAHSLVVDGAGTIYAGDTFGGLWAFGSHAQILGHITGPSPGYPGYSMVLADDGTLLMAKNGTLFGYQFTAGNVFAPVLQMSGPGNYPFQQPTLLLVSGPTGQARLLIDAANLPAQYNPPYSWVGYDLGHGTGPAPPPAWSMYGGEPQRRFSLRP